MIEEILDTFTEKEGYREITFSYNSNTDVELLNKMKDFLNANQSTCFDCDESKGEGYKRKSKSFEEILDEVDKSVTSDELFKNGEIIEDSEGYEVYYSDTHGGKYNRVRIVKLDGKFYVYKEKVIISNDSSDRSECIAFYELK